MKRQGESYSYGAAGWLNDPDGVAFRMESSKTPIERDQKGSSALYTVKDRYGDVQRWGERQDEGEGTPWYYLGQFVVDSTPPADTYAPATRIHVSVPAKNAEGAGKDRTDYLADAVLAYLKETTGKFSTFTYS